jgi:four helix bundle protein
MFTHEKFEAYQLAIQFTHLALQCLDEMPPGNANLRDQLRRAAFSISLNIAEGTGKNGRSDRVRFYSIARGSAMECAAICDIIGIVDTRLLPKTGLAKAKLKSIVSILSAVCSPK